MLYIENEFFKGQIGPEQGARLLSLTGKRWGNPESIVKAPCGGQVAGQKATAFPLIPFGGRLQDGIFAWQDGTVQLPCKPGEFILHGDGARRRWQVSRHSENSLTLEIKYPSAGWPFPAHVQIRYLLRGPVFWALFAVRNLCDRPIPFGLGWHPYLAFSKDHWLTCNVTHRARLNSAGFSPQLRADPGSLTLTSRDGPATWQFRLGPGPISVGRNLVPIYDIFFSSTVDYLVAHLAPDNACVAIEPLTHPLHDPGACIVPAGGRRTMAVSLRLR